MGVKHMKNPFFAQQRQNPTSQQMVCPNVRLVHSFEEANFIIRKGKFHENEVLSIAILSHILNEVNIFRASESPDLLQDEDVFVYFYNGRWIHALKKIEGEDISQRNDVPYSSCSFLWKNHGENLCGDFYPHEVIAMTDYNFFQGIDLLINGILRQRGRVINISSVIYEMNPTWDSDLDEDQAFLDAIFFAEKIFSNNIASSISKIKAKYIIKEAIEKAEDSVMVIDKYFYWQKYFFHPQNRNASRDILYIVYPSKDGQYHCKGIPETPLSFGCRKFFPEEWRGLEGEKLQIVTGVSTATFCHQQGFIAGAKTLDDAINLAKIAAKY